MPKCTKPSGGPMNEYVMNQPRATAPIVLNTSHLLGLLVAVPLLCKPRKLKTLPRLRMISTTNVCVAIDSRNQPVWNPAPVTPNTQSSTAKVMRSKHDESGPKMIINFFMKPMSNYLGRCRKSSSTLSNGIASWDES